MYNKTVNVIIIGTITQHTGVSFLKEDQRGNTDVKVLALHTSEPGLVLSASCGPSSPAEVIPERKAGMTQKQNQGYDSKGKLSVLCAEDLDLKPCSIL